MRTQQGSSVVVGGGVPLPGGSCGSGGSSSGLSPESDSDGGSPTVGRVDVMVDGELLGVGGRTGGGGRGGGGGSLGGTLRGVLSRYWSLESLYSITGECLPHAMHDRKSLSHAHGYAVRVLCRVGYDVHSVCVCVCVCVCARHRVDVFGWVRLSRFLVKHKRDRRK